MRRMKRLRILTERQRQLLAFIEDYVAQNGFPPSIREMAAHMGIRSTNGVNDHLKALERKGCLSRRGGLKSRAITVTDGNGTARQSAPSIPIVGRVAAGKPILAEESIEGSLRVDRALVGEGEVFALRVRGDSMIEKGILDGDLVFVRRQPTANAGQLVVALIEDEATVKTYRPARDHIALEPANRAFEPIIIPRGKTAEIIGIVTGVFRRC